MSLYRQQGGRSRAWTAALALVVLLVGIGIGFAIGRSSAPEPSLSEEVGDVRTEVQPVLDGISLVPDHYAQSVRGGEVVEPVQYEGARQQLATARDALAAASADLVILSAENLAAAEDRLGELADAVDGKEDAAEVARLAARAEAAVEAAAGGDGNGR